MFSDFWLLPLFLSFDPKCKGKLRGLKQHFQSKMIKFHRISRTGKAVQGLSSSRHKWTSRMEKMNGFHGLIMFLGSCGAGFFSWGGYWFYLSVGHPSQGDQQGQRKPQHLFDSSSVLLADDWTFTATAATELGHEILLQKFSTYGVVTTWWSNYCH